MSDESKRDGEHGQPLPEGPGTRLRKAREARGFSVEDITEALGLSSIVVRTLEAEEFEHLGAPVYARGYLRKYARFLGLSGDELVADYEAAATPHDPEVHAHATTALPRRSTSRWLAPATAVILVAVLVLVGLWGWRHVRQHNSSARVPAAAVSAAMALTGIPPAGTAHAVVAGSGGRPQAGGSQAGGSQAVSPAVLPGVKLELDVKTPSWVEVYAPDGERLYYNLASAGQQLSFDAASGALTVFLGNADGVTVLVNGRPFPIPANSRSGNTARFEVGSKGSPAPAPSSAT